MKTSDKKLGMSTAILNIFFLIKLFNFKKCSSEQYKKFKVTKVFVSDQKF